MAATATQTDTQAKVEPYSTDVPWYYKEIGEFSPACRELLEKYSHIPPEEVIPHILEIRERAWALQPYPCIGRFRFLDLSISLQPCYPRILSLLKGPQSQHTLLDLGCCFAQDIRKLAYDGVPSENLYACDLEQSFLDLSYDLFKDKDTLKAHLFIANAFDEGGALDELQGKIDIVHASSFLHLFSWDDQLKLCKRIIKVLKPRKGSIIFGRQTGNLKGQEVPGGSLVSNAVVWRHNVESFSRLWEVAGRETETKWKTWGELDTGDGTGVPSWGEEGFRWFRFEVERVE